MAHGTDKLIELIVSGLTPRQKRVLFRRYGLTGDGRVSTLQEIGDEFGITRERVRQIENQSLKKIKKSASAHAAELLKIAASHLEVKGGAREDEMFIREIGAASGLLKDPKSKAAHKNRVRFALIAAGNPLYYPGDKKLKSFWFASENIKNSVYALIQKTLDAFRVTPRDRILEEKEIVKDLVNTPHYDFLLISRHFGVGPFGDLGLVEWAEIRPKNVRDKAYLALKKTAAPMHFSEIAKLVKTLGISRRPVNVQTIHNELIKDDRFTLVGRGIYALRERGFEPGTVREVIAELIRNHGPLKPEEVIRLVGARRVLKDNTILLSLQNRDNFVRLEDGRYDIHSA